MAKVIMEEAAAAAAKVALVAAVDHAQACLLQ